MSTRPASARGPAVGALRAQLGRPFRPVTVDVAGVAASAGRMAPLSFDCVPVTVLLRAALLLTPSGLRVAASGMCVLSPVFTSPAWPVAVS